MAARRGTSLLAVLCSIVGIWALMSMSQAFVAAPAGSALRGNAVVQQGEAERMMSGSDFATAAALGMAVGTLPQAAQAATAGYAFLQVGWALFFIALGPAFLLWVYFNKPEVL
mmetsp:Transcript_26226/g.47921  ORF Transcript_26226/g.47921 Transcript_26226/m.47921 type:complete len:113 (+) Transcript_26226:93-431(+)